MSDPVTVGMVENFFLGYILGVSTVTVIWFIWTEARRKDKQTERKVERLEKKLDDRT